MFVCPDPAPLLDIVLKLVETVDTDNDFPRLRAGVASGMAVSRAGDWFGSPVNVASRVTGVARPGTVLVADSVWEAVGDTRRAFIGRSPARVASRASRMKSNSSGSAGDG